MLYVKFRNKTRKNHMECNLGVIIQIIFPLQMFSRVLHAVFNKYFYLQSRLRCGIVGIVVEFSTVTQGDGPGFNSWTIKFLMIIKLNRFPISIFFLQKSLLSNLSETTPN